MLINIRCKSGKHQDLLGREVWVHKSNDYGHIGNIHGHAFINKSDFYVSYAQLRKCVVRIVSPTFERNFWIENAEDKSLTATSTVVSILNGQDDEIGTLIIPNYRLIPIPEKKCVPMTKIEIACENASEFAGSLKSDKFLTADPQIPSFPSVWQDDTQRFKKVKVTELPALRWGWEWTGSISGILFVTNTRGSGKNKFNPLFVSALAEIADKLTDPRWKDLLLDQAGKLEGIASMMRVVATVIRTETKKQDISF
jgi:hypothetical protein